MVSGTATQPSGSARTVDEVGSALESMELAEAIKTPLIAEISSLRKTLEEGWRQQTAASKQGQADLISRFDDVSAEAREERARFHAESREERARYDAESREERARYDAAQAARQAETNRLCVRALHFDKPFDET